MVQGKRSFFNIMKKKLILISIILLFAGTVIAASFKPFAFPFIGRWQPTEDPVLIDDYGFQDIQNLRKDGKRLKGVSGHTKINTSVWNATYKYPKNGFQFKKDQPSETHTIVLATDASGANGTLYQNTTAIPSQGNFSGTVLHTDDASAGLGRFSTAPKGNMAYINGEETLIWGGDELTATSFIVSTAAITGTVTAPKDFSDEVRNTRQTGDEVAQITNGLDANTVLMLHCDGADASTTFTDSSTTPHTPAAQDDAQIDTDFKKFGTGSGIFDGTGDYLSIPDHADFNFGSNPFTIDFQVRTTSGLGIFGSYDDADNSFRLTVAANGTVIFAYYNGGFQGSLTSSSGAVPDDTQTHIAIIRGWSGTANLWALTVNGTAVDTDTIAGAMPDLADVFKIGNAEHSAGTYEYDGHIDEFRVSKGVARWTANFTPPVRPYKNIGLYWLVGATRPLQGVKYYVKTANTIASTMTAKEWNGSSWEDLAITDNTKPSAISLAQTGTVTWATTEDTSKTALLQGLSLFWYQFNLSAGEAEIYYVTADAPIQTIKNIWSTDPSPCVNFNVFHTAAWKDYTLEVNSESSQEYSTDLFAAQVGAQTSAEYIYVGFLEQQTAINVKMTVDINAEAATVTIYYWDGSGWVSVGTVVDGTDVGGNPLSRSGYISWNAPAREEEFTQNLFGLSYQKLMGQRFTGEYEPYGPGNIEGEPNYAAPIYEPVYGKKLTTFDNTNAYFYKIVWSATLGADVKIDFVSGVPATYEVPGYEFPAMYQNRLFLFSEKADMINACIYSAYENPDTLNGKDSGYIKFGDQTKIIAASTLYNLYRTVGIEQLIVAKAHETYRVVGSGPQTWEKYQMSSNIGCIAPLSMATCDVAVLEEGVKRQVVIWSNDKGVVATDGATIDYISKDIACYWDANDSRAIPTNRLDDSFGWYDPDVKAYKLLISSGSGQTTDNIELEYSLETKEWTKLYRENGSGANPLQAGFVVHDTVGKSYTYGMTNEGTMYRLENGKTWDSTAITQYVHTKDLMLDEEQPLFKHTNIHYLRLLFEDKATGATEDIDIIHYGDQVETTHGTNDQFVPTDIDMADGPHELRECTLGPFLYHSFKFTAIMSTVSDGMELTGMGLYYETKKNIME